MRKALLTGLTAFLFLIGSCAPTDKCKDPSYVYKEGEHPERHVAPKPELPKKTIPIDYTYENPKTKNQIALSSHTNSIEISEKQIYEVTVKMYPTRANRYIEKTEKEEEILVAKYDIDLSKEKEYLEYRHPGINDGPHVIYHGSEHSKSVLAETSRGFPLSRYKNDSIKGERLYLFPKNFAGSAFDARDFYFQGLEYALHVDKMEKEMQVSGQ